jgi:hypothetical protein
VIHIFAVEWYYRYKSNALLDSTLYKTLKLRAVEVDQTISGRINKSLQAQLIDDLEDVQSVHSRLASNEKLFSY